jgi:2-polyprenyl-3-methyl-5-hydroxy-6-metoxy-1,4-benzoquinol methylase
MVYLSNQQIAEIRDVPYFKAGHYADLDIGLTLDYMTRRYLIPLKGRLGKNFSSIADCAAGYGWLTFAFLLNGGEVAFLIEPDPERLEASKRISTILGVSDRCRFLNQSLEDVELAEDSVDVFASIETLEHVGRDAVLPCVNKITSVTKSAVVLTTPNKIFPIIAHDTQLPFAHWMPKLMRKVYSQMFNREQDNIGNYFLGPWHLLSLFEKFTPSSSYQTFHTLKDFDDFYPHYLPYGRDEKKRKRTAPSKGLRAFVGISGSIFRNYSFLVSPNLSTIWLRR